MDKFDAIRMAELVKIEDPDAEGGITLIFQNNKKMKIKIVNNKLESQVLS